MDNNHTGGEIWRRGYGTIRRKKYETIEEKIKSPYNGIVYFVENKIDGDGEEYIASIDIYVVSYFDDYKRFCKWHKMKDMKNNGEVR